MQNGIKVFSNHFFGEVRVANENGNSKQDGTTLVTTTSKVTGKGQVYFINKLLKEHATNKIKQNQ